MMNQPVTVSMAIQSAQAPGGHTTLRAVETLVKIVSFLLTMQVDITRITNYCVSNSNHCKDPGFGKMDEL